MKLSDLFSRCLSADYRHVEDGASYALSRTGSTLTVFLEHSNGAVDWCNNLDFPARAHLRKGKRAYFCHRGFLRVFFSLLPYVENAVGSKLFRRIECVGYSHGAALALLLYEYIWEMRPDLREDGLFGWGFGCPRVLWGLYTPAFLARFHRFTVVRNLDDAVTHLPPAVLGYRHVGEMLTVGERGRYTAVDAHRPENIAAELLVYENSAGI